MNDHENDCDAERVTCPARGIINLCYSPIKESGEDDNRSNRSLSAPMNTPRNAGVIIRHCPLLSNCVFDTNIH